MRVCVRAAEEVEKVKVEVDETPQLDEQRERKQYRNRRRRL